MEVEEEVEEVQVHLSNGKLLLGVSNGSVHAAFDCWTSQGREEDLSRKVLEPLKKEKKKKTLWWSLWV